MCEGKSLEGLTVRDGKSLIYLTHTTLISHNVTTECLIRYTLFTTKTTESNETGVPCFNHSNKRIYDTQFNSVYAHCLLQTESAPFTKDHSRIGAE